MKIGSLRNLRRGHPMWSHVSSPRRTLLLLRRLSTEARVEARVQARVFLHCYSPHDMVTTWSPIVCEQVIRCWKPLPVQGIHFPISWKRDSLLESCPLLSFGITPFMVTLSIQNVIRAIKYVYVMRSSHQFVWEGKSRTYIFILFITSLAVVHAKLIKRIKMHQNENMADEEDLLYADNNQTELTELEIIRKINFFLPHFATSQKKRFTYIFREICWREKTIPFGMAEQKLKSRGPTAFIRWIYSQSSSRLLLATARVERAKINPMWTGKFIPCFIWVYSRSLLRFYWQLHNRDRSPKDLNLDTIE